MTPEKLHSAPQALQKLPGLLKKHAQVFCLVDEKVI